MSNNNKKYTNNDWLIKMIFQNATLDIIADHCGVSKHTCSRYVNIAVNTLTIDQLVELSKCRRDMRIISPKTVIYDRLVKVTSYLPPSSSIRQRLWHVEHNTIQPPTCIECDELVGWETDKQQYREFCSIKCSASSTISSNRRQLTNTKKRGVPFWNQQHIPQQSLEKLQDKTWLVEQHKILKKSLIRIAEELNVHPLLPAQYLSRHGVPGNQNSQASTDLIDFISSHYIGDIITNDRKILQGKELDIYLPEIQTAFEFNGIYWHSELAGKDKNYHRTKTLNCARQDIQLIHIFEHEWNNSRNITQSRILSSIDKSPNRIMARKCKIVNDITPQHEKQFLNNNHSQGYIPSTNRIALTLDDDVVAIMTFRPSRFNNKYDTELLRFCCTINTNVIGGASKLFKHFIKTHKESIISYSNKAWGNGNLYTQLGFAYSHTSNPNYRYFLNNSYNTFSRQKFQKHKLSKILETFDPSLSEWENMKNNGYNRIWDCGSDVFIWNHN